MGTVLVWLAGGLTLTAVVVALRQALLAQREAARARHTRLVDHELERRRENLRCLGELWEAIAKANPEFVRFRAYVSNLPPQSDPNKPRTDNATAEPGDIPGEPVCDQFGRVVERFVNNGVFTIEPPLFMALALLADSP